MKRILAILLFLSAIIAVYLFYRLHDRHPDHSVNIDIRDSKEGKLFAGFSAVRITPEVPDTWTDANNDAVFNEKDGDTYQDKNGNGKFDVVWMAGFQNNRPAIGIHDDLWARTMVIDDGSSRIALVALDLIGFGADDILEVKKRIPEEWDITYCIITSTHTHEGPDAVGLWGESKYKSGVDADYLQEVKEKILISLGDAVKHMRPARIRLARDAEGAKNLVGDYRKPIAFDYGLQIMQITDYEADTALGTLIQWANHPETLGSDNLLVSSDYPHYLREAFEKGLYIKDSLIHKGNGGITLFVNGALGGMMSTGSDVIIPSLAGDTSYVIGSYEKIKAQGEHLALIALKALDNTHSQAFDSSAIKIRAITIELPLYNKLYRLGTLIGIFNRGLSGWWKIRTELAIWQLGPAAFLHEPGELYPEIANGNTEAPEGRDFPVTPSENIPLRMIMPGEYHFIVGLSNDFIGYILPQSQWDTKSPYTYGEKEAPYGEINSVGPQTAPILYKAMTNLIGDMKATD